jgi:D-arabinose 1-dehydrogenase-like Zn-dependent alcohol dehydrogenase
MKAAVIRGTQKIVIEDMPVPEPGPNQVLVKIRYSALCGSDGFCQNSASGWNSIIPQLLRRSDHVLPTLLVYIPIQEKT